MPNLATLISIGKHDRLPSCSLEGRKSRIVQGMIDRRARLQFAAAGFTPASAGAIAAIS